MNKKPVTQQALCREEHLNSTRHKQHRILASLEPRTFTDVIHFSKLGMK